MSDRKYRLGTVKTLISETQRNKIITYLNSSTYTKHIPIERVENIEVWANGVPVRRGGIAKISRNKMELHTTLLKDGREEERNLVFFHEIGHFVAYWQGGKGHGQIWKQTMRGLGYPNSAGKCPLLNFLHEDHEPTAREQALGRFNEHIGRKLLTTTGMVYTLHSVRPRANKYPLIIKDDKNNLYRLGLDYLKQFLD